MTELQRRIDAQADKVDKEYSMLESMLDFEQDEDRINLTLAQAKRVKREGTVLVRVLAQMRDHLQPQGGTR